MSSCRLLLCFKLAQVEFVIKTINFLSQRMAKPKKAKGKKGGDTGKSDEQKDKILEKMD